MAEKLEKLAVDGGTPLFAESLATNIPTWPPIFPETEEKLIEVYRSGKWGLKGKYEKLLMEEFAKYQTAKYCEWMCNGTTTLECAMLALDIGPGDEVIVPGVTWIATAQAPIYCGAKPVIVDIDPDTLCIDPKRIEEAITPRTKAIIPVHLYSAMADMDAINAIAKKHNLYVVEDCAHAHGAKQHGKGAGSIGDIGSFSFQLSKLMTSGEGGCTTTNDLRLHDRLFRLSHIGNSALPENPPLEKGLPCHQYRFTEFQAAIIYDQLQHMPELTKTRNDNMQRWFDLIKDLPGIRPQKSAFADDERSYYFVTFLLQKDELKEGATHSGIAKALAAEGLELGTGWGKPLYSSVIWNIPEDQYVKMDTPVCEDVMKNRILCTMHTMAMDRSIVEKAAAVMRKVMPHFAK